MVDLYLEVRSREGKISFAIVFFAVKNVSRTLYQFWLYSQVTVVSC
ncbi:hypothetical protein [Tychonema sp. LEGE 07203]|nr:hypothetical protein [Tychonema sp. LEGE 07203]MBE9097126.1 hypothetical protein [Tychonema sp. LEGE 07203]